MIKPGELKQGCMYISSVHWKFYTFPSDEQARKFWLETSSEERMFSEKFGARLTRIKPGGFMLMIKYLDGACRPWPTQEVESWKIVKWLCRDEYYYFPDTFMVGKLTEVRT